MTKHTLNGTVISLKEIASKAGISRQAVSQKLQSGLSVEEIIARGKSTRPTHVRRKSFNLYLENESESKTPSGLFDGQKIL